MAQLVEPNQPLAAGWKDETRLTLKTHMNHGVILLNEAYRLSNEHALYEAFDWCLNFNAGRKSTATTRFSVWPQAKLFCANPLSDLKDPVTDSGDDADLSEYVPTDEMKNLNIKKQPHAGASAVEGINVPSTSKGRITRSKTKAAEFKANASKGKATSNKTKAKARPKAIIKQSRTEVADDSEDLDATSFRITDFLVSVTQESKPVGVHSLWEIKAFPELISTWFTLNDDEKARYLHLAFIGLQRQLLEQAACVFYHYHNKQTVSIMAAVGYYLRFNTFTRDKMPPVDFFRKKTLPNIDQYFAEQSRVCHLVDLPDGKDYSRGFKAHWEQATEFAMKDVDAAADVDPEELPIDDVSHLVNVLLKK